MAIDLDPTFAPAYEALSQRYMGLAMTGVRPEKEVLPKAIELAEKALRLDPSLSDAHSLRGFAKLLYNRDWQGAEREISQAIKLNPNSPIPHLHRCHYLRALGRFDEGIAECQRALALDPQRRGSHAALAVSYLHAGRYDESIAAHQRLLGLDPFNEFNRWAVHLNLARSFAGKGVNDLAVHHCQEAVKMTGEKPTDTPTSPCGSVFATAGRPDLARKVLQQLLNQWKRMPIEAYRIASTYASLGEKELALEWLEKAYEEYDQSLTLNLYTDPNFDPLRPDPRFQALVSRLAIPAQRALRTELK